MNNKLWALLCTVWLMSSTVLYASETSETPSIAYLNVATEPSGELSASIRYPLSDFLSVSNITLDDKPTSNQLSDNRLIIERWLNEHFRFTADGKNACSLLVSPSRLRLTTMANRQHIDIGTTLDCPAEQQLRISYLASVIDLPIHQLIFTAVEQGQPITRLFNQRQESLVWMLAPDNNADDHSNSIDTAPTHQSHGRVDTSTPAVNGGKASTTARHSQHHHEGAQSMTRSTAASSAGNQVAGSPVSGQTVFIVCTLLFVAGLFITWRVIKKM